MCHVKGFANLLSIGTVSCSFFRSARWSDGGRLILGGGWQYVPRPRQCDVLANGRRREPQTLEGENQVWGRGTKSWDLRMVLGQRKIHEI